MKSRRHDKILELISKNDIKTQEELLDFLAEEGFDVTQATISRDIKELRLIKTLASSGKYRYSTEKTASHDISSKFHSLFSDSVIMVAEAGNLIVIRTIAGMANAVCAAMDPLEFKEIIGTIAGDDTIFVACRSESEAQALSFEFKKYISKR